MSTRTLPMLEPGTVINKCEVLEAVGDHEYRMRCGCCQKEFITKRWLVGKRMVKSCGCLKIRIHSMIMQQAFHNYGGKKNGRRP